MFSKFEPIDVDDSILDRARELCAQYLGGVWKEINNLQFSLSKIGGGLTNLVFRCMLSSEVSIVGSEPRSVILRIQTQTNNLQLMREIAVFMHLSANGYGPKLLGIFPGGRIEEFIPSRTLKKEEVCDRRFVPAIASLIAKLNNIEMPLPKYPQYIPLIQSWLQKYKKNGGGSLKLLKTAVVGDVSFPDVITMDELEKEIAEVERFLSMQKNPSVFCHQDTVPANILLRDVDDDAFDIDGAVDSRKLVIIDFEFGCYNYRAFEIANHLAEYGMTYGTPNPPYYQVDVGNMEDENLALSFCSAYLNQVYKDHTTAVELERQFLTGQREKDLNILMSESRRFLSLPHLFWGVWNILCDQELGMVQGMDFLTHARDRFIMYFMFKSNMYKY